MALSGYIKNIHSFTRSFMRQIIYLEKEKEGERGGKWPFAISDKNVPNLYVLVNVNYVSGFYIFECSIKYQVRSTKPLISIDKEPTQFRRALGKMLKELILGS